MTLYTVLYYGSILAIPIIILALEIIQKHKEKTWVKSEGRVIQYYIRTIIDVSSIFIDIEYIYKGKILSKREINTRTMNSSRFQSGNTIEVFVDPAAPQNVVIAKFSSDIFGISAGSFKKIFFKSR